VSIAIKKGETFATISIASKEKATVEEKGKRAFHRTKIGMDFDLKTFKLRDQEAVNKYLVNYEFRLNPGIKIEFCPRSVNVSSAPPEGEGVCMHPHVLSLG